MNSMRVRETKRRGSMGVGEDGWDGEVKCIGILLGWSGLGWGLIGHNKRPTAPEAKAERNGEARSRVISGWEIRSCGAIGGRASLTARSG